MGRLAARLFIASLVPLGAMAAPPTGGWIFESSPDFPGFTRIVIEQDAGKPTGKVTSRWYGDQPLKDLRAEGDKLVFRIYNGNPRLTPEDIVLVRDGDKARMTGKLWYQAFDITARRGTAAEWGALDFPTHPLPPRRLVPRKNLAATPPMGWSSWNKFETKIDDRTIREIADALVATGLRDAGYVYVNIDDGWQGRRDDSGRIHSNARFPDMKALADYVHARGLKLGIYSSPGPRSCAYYEGSFGHEEADARTFAEWGIDYLKYDWCSARAIYREDQMRAVFQKMADALRATGRNIVYSLCQYGLADVWSWGSAAGGNLWRTTGDIADDWRAMSWIGFGQNELAHFAGPGHWNDPDMLEVGNGGMSANEYRTHMSLWALLAAPLLAGNDLRSASAETLAILTHPEVIAIDQDSLGRQGARSSASGAAEIWAKPLAGGRQAVGLFNRGEEAAEIGVLWKDLGIAGGAAVRDVWSRTDLGARADGYSVKVPAHGVALLVVTPAAQGAAGPSPSTPPRVPASPQASS